MKIYSNGKMLEVSGGGQTQDIYSTEEQRIGTWIDGNPLYRKTYYKEITTQAEKSRYFAIDSSFFNTLIKAEGFFAPDGWNSIYSLPFMEMNPDVTHVYSIGTSYTENDHSLRLNYYTKYATTGHICVTVEYTKPTDSASIELPASQNVSTTSVLEDDGVG